MHDQSFAEEVAAFEAAIEEFKQRTGIKFPAWSHIHTILLSLGYTRDPQIDQGQGVMDDRPAPPRFRSPRIGGRL